MTASYRRALISYIDILGFREMIAETQADSTKSAEILSLLQTMKDELSKGFRARTEAEKKLKRPYHAATFSDHAIRTTFLESNDSLANACNWEFLYLANKQCELASKGVWLTGGICIGDIFTDSDFVFGPGLVQAYLLESSYAVFPRIAIDWEVIQAASEDSTERLWQDYVARGEDGVHFINYLYGSFLDYQLDPGAGSGDQLIAAHKNRIVDSIKKYRTKGDRIRQKYLWLGLYHNSVLKRVREGHDMVLLSDLDPSHAGPKSSLNGLEVPEEMLSW